MVSLEGHGAVGDGEVMVMKTVMKFGVPMILPLPMILPVQNTQTQRTLILLQIRTVAFVWAVSGKGGPRIDPPSIGSSISTLKDIIKMLPPVSNILHFVDMLIMSSRHCQLVGADYKFILQHVLGEMYDEDELVKKVRCLHSDSNRVTKTEVVEIVEVQSPVPMRTRSRVLQKGDGPSI